MEQDQSNYICRKNRPPDCSSLSKRSCQSRSPHKNLLGCERTPHHKIKMSTLLEKHEWTSVLSTQCIQEKVQNFQSALVQMFNYCFPVKTVLMSSRDPPFMSPMVKRLLKRRQALLRKGGQNQNPNVIILQERINKLIREN